MLYICNKANKFYSCKFCSHSFPHKKQHDPNNNKNTCTDWRICYIEKGDDVEKIKVRCVKYKGE